MCHPDAHPSLLHTCFTRIPHNRLTLRQGAQSQRRCSPTAPAAVTRVALGARRAELAVGGDHGGRCDDMAAHRGVLAAEAGDADRELLVGNRVAAPVHDAGDRDGGASAELGRRRLPTRSAHGPHSATGPPSRRLPHPACHPSHPVCRSPIAFARGVRKKGLQPSSARAAAGAGRGTAALEGDIGTPPGRDLKSALP